MWPLSILALALLVGAVVYYAMHYHFGDQEYHVPEADRRPAGTMAEWYAQREKQYIVDMINTNKQNKQRKVDQTFTASVMRDGFHAGLPPNAKWQNGKVALAN